ncbi:MAG: leucyl aminopeptidase [Planctomycetes bacterium]|nr:leucyl aminopeptidase [Planctomycetota bacterium]
MSIVKIKKGSALTEKAEALVLLLPTELKSLKGLAKEADGRLGGLVKGLALEGEFKGAVESVALQRIAGSGLAFDWLVLVGLGDEKKVDQQVMRRNGAAIQARLAGLVRSAVVAVDDLALDGERAADLVQAFVEGVELTAYRFDRFKKAEAPKLRGLALVSAAEGFLRPARKGAARGGVIAAAVAQARDLGNLPGNHGRPKMIAAAARAMARKSGLGFKTLGRAEMQKLGMGSLLSVSLGSPHEPQLIVLEHKAKKKNARTVCLVGKGLTFDSGGISLKPGADMDKMRYDRCGGCVVIGALQAAAALQLPINVIGIVPSSENMPGGDANKPGDVVEAANKKTIEILNTDAEGRLILADALVYSKRFKPDLVIDLATLTGACMIALGQHASGLMTRDDDLARELVRAGERCHERTWRLPLWDEYAEEMKGATTDLKNLGGRYGGAITAGAFLENFVETGRWAHLDIAGVSWDDGARIYNKGKGATGYGVRLLVEFLRAQA